MGNPLPSYQLTPSRGAREPISDLARKLERDSRLSLADFPFDPSVASHELTGLDKLRAVEPTSMRRFLWELYWLAEAREENGDAERARRSRAIKAAREELERLRLLSKACLGGNKGKVAREIALHILRDPSGAMREDLQSLRAFEDELRKAKAQERGGAAA